MAGAVFLLLRYKSTQEVSLPPESAQPMKAAASTEEAPQDISHGSTPEEGMISRQSDDKSAICQGLRAKYQSLAEVKKSYKTDTRFFNIHKKVDGITYRLRYFFKDGNEVEIPTYLLYKEDQNDEEHIIESKARKKGPMYLKIEAAIGDITYTEEGLNVGADQDLFLHYVNKKLELVQGNMDGDKALNASEDFIDCKF